METAGIEWASPRRRSPDAPVTPVDEMVVEPEAALFRERWRRVIERDPYFNPHFSRELEDFRIREEPPPEAVLWRDDGPRGS